MNAEGWYRDPYGSHDDRWFSDGHPTSLVRDAGVESQDEPPAGPVPGPLVDVSAPPSHGADDLKRAGEYDNAEPTVWGFDEFMPGSE